MYILYPEFDNVPVVCEEMRMKGGTFMRRCFGSLDSRETKFSGILCFRQQRSRRVVRRRRRRVTMLSAR